MSSLVESPKDQVIEAATAALLHACLDTILKFLSQLKQVIDVQLVLLILNDKRDS